MASWCGSPVGSCHASIQSPRHPHRQWMSPAAPLQHYTQGLHHPDPHSNHTTLPLQVPAEARPASCKPPRASIHQHVLYQDVNTTISDCCFAGAGAGQPRADPAAAGHRRRHAERGVAACAPAAVCVRRPLRRCVCVTSAEPTQHLAQLSSLLPAGMQASAAKQHSTEPGMAADSSQSVQPFQDR